MRKITIIGSLALALVSAAVAAADPGAKKCSADAEQCIRAMTEKLEKRGWIGIEMESGDDRKVITRVVPGSPAETSELRVGDAIVAFNGVSLSDGEDKAWAEVKAAMIPGREITLTIERSGARTDVAVTLAPLPRELMAQWIGQHMLEGHAGAKEEATTADSSRE